MTEPLMITAGGEGLQIRAARWGGMGKTVVAVHGLTANCRCWDLLASKLAPRHTVIALDLRGRGLSANPPTGYSIHHHVRDIIHLLDDLQLERPVVMGHSLGAFISLALAAAHPGRVDRLLLLDGGGEFSDTQRAKVFQGLKPSLDRLGKVFPSFETYLAALKPAPFLQPWNDYLEAYFRYEVEEVPGGLRSRVRPASIEEEILNLKAVSPAQCYPLILCPVLLLRATAGMLAEDDLVLPADSAERMVREIAHIRRVDLPAVNHYSILFQPNPERDLALLEFLER
jgi:pimeloyl-ACP methyl ester carboxylesterase